MTAACLLATADAEDPDADRIRQRAETIQRATQHMSRLVRDLSDLAQIDAGRLAIEKDLEDPAGSSAKRSRRLNRLCEKGAARCDARSVRRCRVSPAIASESCRSSPNLVGNASKVGANSITVHVEPRQGELVFRLQTRDLGLPRRTCRTCSTDTGVGATPTTKGPAWACQFPTAS